MYEKNSRPKRDGAPTTRRPPPHVRLVRRSSSGGDQPPKTPCRDLQQHPQYQPRQQDGDRPRARHCITQLRIRAGSNHSVSSLEDDESHFDLSVDSAHDTDESSDSDDCDGGGGSDLHGSERLGSGGKKATSASPAKPLRRNSSATSTTLAASSLSRFAASGPRRNELSRGDSIPELPPSSCERPTATATTPRVRPPPSGCCSPSLHPLHHHLPVSCDGRSAAKRGRTSQLPPSHAAATATPWSSSSFAMANAAMANAANAVAAQTAAAANGAVGTAATEAPPTRSPLLSSLARDARWSSEGSILMGRHFQPRRHALTAAMMMEAYPGPATRPPLLSPLARDARWSSEGNMSNMGRDCELVRAAFERATSSRRKALLDETNHDDERPRPVPTPPDEGCGEEGFKAKEARAA